MKKVLAWAVVLALVLSSFTMAFAGESKSAKDFSDYDSIQYQEAVDVMVATGIINGYPDGTFGPLKTVKRSEMAKMIACIKNGGEDVGNDYKSACPFADSKDHWAAGYIAYCASEHIIDGRSADVFDPEAEVTGTEVAKMALTSLGYDSKVQGYTGETWAANVLKDAKKNNLFDGLADSFVPSDPCNRESAAQILFNMLKTKEVEYKSTMSVDQDGNVTVDSKLTEKDEMYKDVFGGDLEEAIGHQGSADGKDDYGRPGHAWTYDGEEIGTYSNAPDYDFMAEDQATLEKAVKAALDEEEAAEFYGTDATKRIKNVYVNGESTSASRATVSKGDTVELYALGEQSSSGLDYYRAVVVQYEPYMISSVSTKVSKADAKEGVTAYIYLTQNGGKGDKVKDTELAGYDEETYVEGAVIAVSANSSKVIDSYVMEELVSGPIDKISASINNGITSQSITVDGAKYELAYIYRPVDGNSFYPIQKDVEFTFYDYNGYVGASVKDQAAPAEYSYGVLTAVGSETTKDKYNKETTTYYAKIVTDAAEEKEFVVSDAYVNPETGSQDPVYPYKGAQPGALTTPVLVAYTLEDGELTYIEEAPAAPDALQSGDGATVGNKDVLAGYYVTEDSIAFANIGTADEPEWKVYGYDEITAEDAVIKANTCFIDLKAEAYQALLLTASLEEPAAADVDLGFIAKVTEEGQLADGTAVLSLEAYLNGDDEVTTFTDVPMENISWPDESIAGMLFAFTENADGETVIAPAQVEEATALVDKFATGKVAAGMMGVTITDKTDGALAIGNKDFQEIGKATIYYLNNEDNAIEVIGEGDIDDYAIEQGLVKAWFYQTEEGATSWNLVFIADSYLDLVIGD